MEKIVRRIFSEKKCGYDIEAQALYKEIKEYLGIIRLKSVRIVNRYDIWGVSDEVYEKSRSTIFSEPAVDYIYDEYVDTGCGRAFAVEYLPGQYDQRADSAAQCVQILSMGEKPEIRSARIIILDGDITDDEFDKIKKYCINPVDSREASMEKPDILDMEIKKADSVAVLDNFIRMDKDMLIELKDNLELAMNIEDLYYCQSYFNDVEKRNPTITEIRVIDTYWSDHCRHGTFLSDIEDVVIEKGKFTGIIEKTYSDYLKSRKLVYKDEDRAMNLMDLATIAMKELKIEGLVADLDISDEINACSISVDVDVDGVNEEWLIMFKNETHNHPTEIEPFGGAATCLGGAIRDPLSGRAYVYQAMRVTGSGDPRIELIDTPIGKLPQRKITTGAAAGYSSYGNQVGLATGLVSEVYDEGFIAKRMEIGAVIGAVPKKNVIRMTPCSGDRVILLGGRTGRDGCGGATGSSREHDEKSLERCGAEVQKGNAPTERKIQRLFRNPEVSAMIKRCNDFGAGGVSVAIGELADGLIINLDAVLKKYEGLDGTEIAISESQERMAVAVDKENVERFIKYSYEENLEACEAAEVTDDKRLRMIWNGRVIVDISRDFLNTNGVRQRVDAYIKAPDTNAGCFNQKTNSGDLKEAWLANLKDLNVCSKRGLVERFDSTIGAGTVLMPFGGKYQLTPAECMAAKIPVPSGNTSKATVMSYGYDPVISKWSPFHGAVYSIVHSVSKIVAAGGDYRKVRLTLQEYFEKLGRDAEKWGKPLSALLGAYYAQMCLCIPAIGGKDSMSGTFRDLNVPPTLVSFAVNVVDADNIISPEFKNAGSSIVLIKCPRDEYELPVFEKLRENYIRITELIGGRKILSAFTVGRGGIAGAISRMAFGNKIGISFHDSIDISGLFSPEYGAIILEIGNSENLDLLFSGIHYELLGTTIDRQSIEIKNESISIEQAIEAWETPLEKIFHTRAACEQERIEAVSFEHRNCSKPGALFARPRVFMPVFPGTNCEYDTARAFERAGGVVDTLVIRNMSSSDIEETIEEMAKRINNSQIIAIPGGFSGGDEPDGSGKFIATTFRNPGVSEAVMKLLNIRDGLVLGICNGFQALIKLGLLPYGEIRDIDELSPTLTFNSIGRHMSRMVDTKVVSVLSPWFKNANIGDIHTIPISHGEGRFIANKRDIDIMIRNGQIATQYVDFQGIPSCDISFNPNGSVFAIEGITSPDGRILGKMGHSERVGGNLYRNIPGEKDQRIFESGIAYFE